MSDDAALGWLGVPLAVVAGAIRVSTPFILVSLGECLTERSGRINLGLEGTLVLGAMTGYGVSYLSGSPWLGVLAAGTAGALFGLLHGWLCSLRRVNDICVANIRIIRLVSICINLIHRHPYKTSPSASP